MTCTVIIPSRYRFDKLLTCLESIYSSTDSRDFEVLLKFDTDDDEFKARGHELCVFPKCYFITAVRGGGWAHLDHEVYSVLEDKASGHWIFIGNDDMLVTGDWLNELKRVPETGYLVQPEVSKIGPSTYEKAEGQAFPIVPKHAWKKYSHRYPTPFDSEIHVLLVKLHGWKTWFLSGVTFWHNRGGDDEINRHRL